MDVGAIVVEPSEKGVGELEAKVSFELAGLGALLTISASEVGFEVGAKVTGFIDGFAVGAEDTGTGALLGESVGAEDISTGFNVGVGVLDIMLGDTVGKADTPTGFIVGIGLEVAGTILLGDTVGKAEPITGAVVVTSAITGLSVAGTMFGEVVPAIMGA